VTIDLPDVRLAYDDTGGERDAVLFVHGFPHGRRLWAPQLAALGDWWRCIAPDLRGFGDSEARAPYAIDRYADDLAALLDALGIARTAVVGLSMGGYTALALWRRHAARVRALVLADTRAAADDEATRARRLAHMALVRRGGLAALADVQLPGALARSTREARPDVVDSFRTLMEGAGSVDGMVGALEAMCERADSTASLATITVPTLLVVGAEDAVTRPSEMRALQQRIPGSRLVVIPAAGHVSNWEQPTAFNGALAEFLASLR
jgi:pimeloyl-ACP methyl ester carboxylesterase